MIDFEEILKTYKGDKNDLLNIVQIKDRLIYKWPSIAIKIIKLTKKNISIYTKEKKKKKKTTETQESLTIESNENSIALFNVNYLDVANTIENVSEPENAGSYN